jgi:hypothetical protein
MGNFQDKVAQSALQAGRDQADTLVWRVTKKVSTAFTGGSSNAHGNDGGTLDPYPLFSVEGDVVIKFLVGICNVDLVGAATLEVGVAGNTAKLLQQIANVTTLDANDVWTDAGTEASIDIVPAAPLYFIANGADIIETVGTTNITAGQIDYYVIWAPLEAGASIVAA